LKLSASHFWEFFGISLLILAAIVFSGLYQKQITFQNGRCWDGLEYCKMAEQIVNNQPISARAPFVYRIGTSFLAAKLFPYDLNYGFKFINICAGVVGIYLLWFWLTLFIQNKAVRSLLSASYIFYWQAPLRFSFYFPFHADSIALMFLFAGLILLKYIIDAYSIKKLIFFTGITFIGVFFREICLIPALILILIKIYPVQTLKSNPTQTLPAREGFKKKSNPTQTLPTREDFKTGIKTFFNNFFSSLSPFGEGFKLSSEFVMSSVYIVPLFLGITGIIITHFLGSQDNNYSFFKSAVFWIYKKAVFQYFHAWFLSIGSIFTVVLYYFSENIEFMKKNKYIFIHLLIMIFISFAGGSDTERMIIWSVPVIYVLIGNIVSKHKNVFNSPIILIIIILTQLISIRAFLLIPDYPDNDSFQIPFLTPISNHFPLFNLWTIHGDEKILLISFTEYVTLALFLSYYFWGKDKNINTF
jgi:hypothetical protein